MDTIKKDLRETSLEKAVNPFYALVDAIADRVVEKMRATMSPTLSEKVGLPRASKLMGVSVATIRNMIVAGDIKAHRQGSRYLIAVAEIQAWGDRTRIS